MDFVVPADHRTKLKESEKKNKYLDFAREGKKLWNLKVTVILIVISTLDTVTKGLGDLEIKRCPGQSGPGNDGDERVFRIP